MMIEALESRALLAADSCVDMSLYQQLDVNDDDAVSAVDALQVINRLNANDSGILAPAEDPVDVNRDGAVTALDALLIINAIAYGEIQPIHLVNDTAPGNSINRDRVTADLTLAGTVCWPSDLPETDRMLSIIANDAGGQEKIIPISSSLIVDDYFQISGGGLSSKLRPNTSVPAFEANLQLVVGQTNLPATQRNVVAELGVIFDMKDPEVAVPTSIGVSDEYFRFAILDGLNLTQQTLQSLRVRFEGSMEPIEVVGELDFQSKTYRTEVSVPIRVHDEATSVMVLIDAVLEDVAGNVTQLSIREPISIQPESSGPETTVLADWRDLVAQAGQAFDLSRPSVNPRQVVTGKVDIPNGHLSSVLTLQANESSGELSKETQLNRVDYDPAAGTLQWTVDDHVVSGPIELNDYNVRSDYRQLISDLQIVPSVWQVTPDVVNSWGYWDIHDANLAGIDMELGGFRYRFLDDSANLPETITREETDAWDILRDDYVVPITGFRPIQIAGADGVSEFGELPFANLPESTNEFSVRPNESILLVGGGDLIQFDFVTAVETGRVPVADLLDSLTEGAVEFANANWIERIYPQSLETITPRIEYFDVANAPQSGDVWIVRSQSWMGIENELVIDGQTLLPLGRIKIASPFLSSQRWTSYATDTDGLVSMEIEATGERWRTIDLTTGELLSSGNLPNPGDSPRAIESDSNINPLITNGATPSLSWQFQWDRTFVYWDANHQSFVLWGSAVRSLVDLSSGATRQSEVDAVYLFDSTNEIFQVALPSQSLDDKLALNGTSVTAEGKLYWSSDHSQNVIARQQIPEILLYSDSPDTDVTIDLGRLGFVADLGEPHDPTLPSVNTDQNFRLYGKNLGYDSAIGARVEWRSYVAGDWGFGSDSVAIRPIEIASDGHWADYKISGIGAYSDFVLIASGQSIPIEHVPSIVPNLNDIVGPTQLSQFQKVGIGTSYRLWVDGTLVDSCQESLTEDSCRISGEHGGLLVTSSVEIETPQGRHRFELPPVVESEAQDRPWTIDGIESFEPRFGGQVSYAGIRANQVLAGSEVSLSVTAPEDWITEQATSGRSTSVLVHLLPDQPRSDGRSLLSVSGTYLDGLVRFTLPPSFAGGRVQVEPKEAEYGGAHEFQFRLELAPTIIGQVGDSRLADSTVLLAGHDLNEGEWTIDGLPAISRPGPFLTIQHLPTVEIIVPNGVSEGVLQFDQVLTTMTSPPILPWWVGEMPQVDSVDFAYPSLPSVSYQGRVDFVVGEFGEANLTESGDYIKTRTLQNDWVSSGHLKAIASDSDSSILVGNLLVSELQTSLFGTDGSHSLHLLPVVAEVAAIHTFEESLHRSDPDIRQRISIITAPNSSSPPPFEVNWGEQSWEQGQFDGRYVRRLIDRYPESNYGESEDTVTLLGPSLSDLLWDKYVFDRDSRTSPQLASFNLPELPAGEIRLKSIWGVSSFEFAELPEVRSRVEATVAASGTPADPSLPSVNVGQLIDLPAEFRNRGDNLFFDRIPLASDVINRATWTMAESTIYHFNDIDSHDAVPYVELRVPHDAVTGQIRLGLFGEEIPIQIIPTVLVGGNSVFFTGGQVGDTLRLGQHSIELTGIDIELGYVTIDFDLQRFADVDVSQFSGNVQLISSGGSSEEIPMLTILLSIEPIAPPEMLPSGIPLYRPGDRVLIHAINLHSNGRLGLLDVGDAGAIRYTSGNAGPVQVSDVDANEFEWEIPSFFYGRLIQLEVHHGSSGWVAAPSLLEDVFVIQPNQ
ncbi:Dockerin type I repeat-containing protein [Neorhodopirellula lusitana]|uniref:Dockerin type I repeat-containing protein n=1 Tax=Neorhodopirellula lusitana TaxID=445327 RepID=A0ABY1PWT4_9BACT|nr:dockerin type I domain-containing protein [Neorhodopirellula lusitana]SMP51003.1 Dockerin type I repeat-containing protein [Neorhodopirellula lusitana]